MKALIETGNSVPELILQRRAFVQKIAQTALALGLAGLRTGQAEAAQERPLHAADEAFVLSF